MPAAPSRYLLSMRFALHQPFVFADLLSLGAASTARAGTTPVADAAGLAATIAGAKAGDEIVLADGTYALTGLTCAADGTPAQPIVVRATTPLGAVVRFDALEGFKVTGASWHFEALDVEGV